jgi:hypothetical protein
MVASSSVTDYRSVASRQPVFVWYRSVPAVLASAYGQLLGLLVEAPEIDAFLEKMAALAADVVTPVVACGLTVRRDGRPYTVARPTTWRRGSTRSSTTAMKVLP